MYFSPTSMRIRSNFYISHQIYTFQVPIVGYAIIFTKIINIMKLSINIDYWYFQGEKTREMLTKEFGQARVGFCKQVNSLTITITITITILRMWPMRPAGLLLGTLPTPSSVLAKLRWGLMLNTFFASPSYLNPWLNWLMFYDDTLLCLPLPSSGLVQ